MPRRGKSDGFENPREPGWYPDPWSATGEGERYFDGERWGTTERPLGRHTVVDLEPRRKQRRARARSERMRSGRSFVPAIVLVVLVAIVLGVQQLTSSDDGKDSTTASTTPAVTSPPTAPPPGTEVAAEPRGKPGPVPDGPGDFQTLLDQENSDVPVAWDPCRPVHYVVNPADPPPDGGELLREAIARVQAATGLQFVDDGVTDEPPTKHREVYQPERYDPNRWAPVLITWSDETAFPDLAGRIAGEGGPTSVVAPSGKRVYVSGQVILDRDDLSTTAASDRAVARAIIQHELGHLVGLGHTADRTQLMFSESEFGVNDFGPGDLRGLALLGTQACFPDV